VRSTILQTPGCRRGTPPRAGHALALAATGVGTFLQALHDDARKRGGTVVSMKDDWKRIFAVDPY
jgi:hypothetical protein